MYSLLTLQEEANVPDMQARQNIHFSGTPTKKIQILMVQNQISSMVTNTAVECLRILDEVAETPNCITVEPKLLEEGNGELAEILEDLTRVALINKYSLKKLHRVVEKAYLKKVFESTETNIEAGQILEIDRTYTSKKFNKLGLIR